MTIYYVHKGVGSDSNSGTSWANCWSSLTKAQAVAGANDTIYVRAGATPYYERLGLSKNGQRWLADAGHTPIVDGKYHDGLSNFNLSDKPPGTYVVQKTGKLSFPSLAAITASDCVIDGFKICNSAGRGLAVIGSRNVVRNCWVDWTYTSGIMVNSDVEGGPPSCADNLIEDTEVTRCSAAVYANLDETVWGRPWDVIVAAKNCETPTFRRLRVHHNHAEGIVLGAGCTGGIVEYCRSWNNEHMCYYVNNSRGSIVRFNVGFSTGSEEVLRKGQYASECLVITEEERNSRADTWARNSQVYGNIFVGGKFVMDIARMGAGQDSQLINVYIGFNTIVGLPDVTQAVLNGGTKTIHETSVFENNIIYAPAGVPIKARANDPMTGLKARGNVIYRPGGAGDVPGWLNGPGTILADPKLVAPGVVIVDNGGVLKASPMAGDNFNANNYKITGSSPAVGAALVDYPFNGNSGAEQARTRDYFGAARADPDAGAHEYGGTVTNSVVASFGRSPAATTLTAGQLVTFTNTSFATGTANITGQTWTVKRGATTVATATTQDFQYTFATAGSYTVTLAVTATGGLSDSEVVAYTVNETAPGVVVTAAFNAAPSQTTIPQGTGVSFTNESTVQNGTLGGILWEVLTLPGLANVGGGTTSPFNYAFTLTGSLRVKLTATATTGESDTETRDYTVTPVSTVVVTAAFTSSDADNIVDEGDSVTFTNTSSVSGTTITGYEWTVTVIGGASSTFTTTDLTTTFPQAGAYLVTLQVNTAAGQSDSETLAILVRGQATAGMDVMVVPVAFTAATSTGTQTVTAAALGTKVPKGVWIRMVGATAGGTAAAGALMSEGAANGTAQWVHCRFSSDGEATTKAWRRYSTTRVMMAIDADGAKTGEAAFGRFVAGGMELAVTDAFPAATLAEAVFFAGDDMTFWAGSVTVGAQDVGVTVAPGFGPDAVYLASSWAAQEDTAEAHAELSRGWATADGGQYHFRNRDAGGAATSALVTRLQPRIGSSADGSGGYCSIEARDFSAAGFQLVPLSSSLNRVASLFAFAAGGHGVALSMVALPTGGAALELPVAFEAQTVLALTSSFSSQNGGQLGGDDAEGQGWYTLSSHGSFSAGGSIAAANGAATSATRQLWSTGFKAVTDAGALYWNGTGAVDADSFDVSWTAAPAAAHRMIVLAIEVGDVLGTPSEEPVADFVLTLEADEDSTSGRTVAWFDGSISNGRGEEITAWAWDFGDGTTSAEASPAHVYAEPGSYVVTLTVTTSAGSGSKTIVLALADLRPVRTPVLVGAIDPATSGGDTANAIDGDTATHTHEIAGAVLKLREMTAAEYEAFVAQEADPVYALVGLYGRQLVIKFADGTTGTVGVV